MTPIRLTALWEHAGMWTLNTIPWSQLASVYYILSVEPCNFKSSSFSPKYIRVGLVLRVRIPTGSQIYFSFSQPKTSNPLLLELIIKSRFWISLLLTLDLWPNVWQCIAIWYTKQYWLHNYIKSYEKHNFWIHITGMKFTKNIYCYFAVYLATLHLRGFISQHAPSYLLIFLY